MSAGGTIRGTVESGGQPLALAPVRASPSGAGKDAGKKTRTDSQGRFELTGLAAGEYLVVVAGRAGTAIRRTVTVAEDQVVELALAEGGGPRLFGRVTTHGAPV